jgi:outer membrane murein-binding lipoprotein Lpp
MKKFFQPAAIAIAALLLAGCGSDRLKDVDLSAVQPVQVTIKRLDRDIFNTPPDSFAAAAQTMRARYGTFYSSFIYNIVNHGEERDSVYKALRLFVTDADMNAVYKMVNDIYTDAEMKRVAGELEKSFTYFSYHFPQTSLPKQYVSFISGFNYPVTTTDTTLGLSLDMYLGADNTYYKMLQWPRYKVKYLDKAYLVTDAMRWWIIHSFDKSEPVNNLLNHMIFHGKMYYALDAVLPGVEDSVKIQYTSRQMAYIAQYKKNLWAHFSEKDRLYKNDLKELAPYVTEGPFTTAISKECPPRIATYVGWQIVRAYMNRHPEVTLQQLMDEKDAQKILTQSRYKP